MEKNIVVTDLEGNVIGSTYLKRAKGLVRSGRADWADDGCIRLLGTNPPVAYYSEYTEDFYMGQIIDFRARDFRMNAECETNVGSRQIITLGEENVECFEIGNAFDAFGCITEIVGKKELEANTDYVFRFAISNAFSGRESASSQISIYPGDDAEAAFVYPMDRNGKNRFRPALCKRDGEELLRVFAIPFTTEEAGSYTFVIRVQDMEVRLFPAKEAECYASLPDITYDQWKQEEQHRWVAKLESLGSKTYDSLSGFGSQLGEKLSDLGGKITKAVGDMVNSAGAAAQKASDRATEAAQKASEKAADAEEAEAQDAVEEAQDAAEEAQGAAEEAQNAADDAAHVADELKSAADSLATAVKGMAADLAEAVKDLAEGAKRTCKEASAEAKEATGEALKEAGEACAEAAREAGEACKEAGESCKEAAGEAKEEIETVTGKVVD